MLLLLYINSVACLSRLCNYHGMSENDGITGRCLEDFREKFLTTTQYFHVKPSATILSHLPSKSKLGRVNGCSRRERKTSGISVVIFSVNGPSVRGEADVAGALRSTGQVAGVRRRRRQGSSHQLVKRQNFTHATKSASYLIRPAPFPNLVLTQPISSVLFSVN